MEQHGTLALTLWMSEQEGKTLQLRLRHLLIHACINVNTEVLKIYGRKFPIIFYTFSCV